MNNQRADQVDRVREQMRAAIRAQLIRQPCVFEVREHLGCDLVFEKTDEGESEVFYLGERDNAQGDRPSYRATPSFKTLEELEKFCRDNLDRFLEIDGDALAGKWFWERDGSSSEMLTRSQ